MEDVKPPERPIKFSSYAISTSTSIQIIDEIVCRAEIFFGDASRSVSRLSNDELMESGVSLRVFVLAFFALGSVLETRFCAGSRRRFGASFAF